MYYFVINWSLKTGFVPADYHSSTTKKQYMDQNSTENYSRPISKPQFLSMVLEETAAGQMNALQEWQTVQGVFPTLARRLLG